MQTSDTIIVRPLATGEEIDTFCYLSTEAFSASVGDIAMEALRWRRAVEVLPEFDPRQRRGAFIGDAPRNDSEHSLRDTFVGGCMIYEREMRVGAARLRTACIGSVVAHPEHRMRGVGTALMRDAIAFAEQNGHALLLLDGIPNFYHRWNYADVYDLTELVIDSAAVAAIADVATGGFASRPATLDDVPALLALYERHYGRYTGSFSRTLEQQRQRLARAIGLGNPPVLAVDTAGNASGYLMLPRAGIRARAGEVAADSWPAAAVLLQLHLRVLGSTSDASTTLAWPLPPDSHTYYLLADHFDAPNATAENVTRAWALRGETYVARRTAWMARPVSLRRVAQALLPAWQGRLAGAGMTAADAFMLRMGDETCTLNVVDGAVQLLPDPAMGSLEAKLTPGQLVQLVFGYRPVGYLATQSSLQIPEPLLPLLDVLFPAGQPWIPWSDGF